MATALLAALLGGCSFLSKEADATEVSSEAEAESPGATQESETETTETEETQESHEAAEDEESGEEETEDHFVEKKIVVATDMHYFAEKLAGNRCDSFVGMARGGDGRVLEYGWEVMDAFLDGMKEEDPDLLILSGDLTLDGEKASHEELAELLEGLREAGIEVAVIPGNHDINNPDARRYTVDGTEKVESITADEFRDIYADFGYVAADSRDPASLSYLYKIDSANWVLMLDSCQYEPKNEVGGMIRRETYEWMEPILEEAEREDVPLCERLNFLAIYQRNLDEFFMVRVGSLHDQMLFSETKRESKTNMTAGEQLSHIFKAARDLTRKKDHTYRHLMDELKEYGVELLNFSDIEYDDAVYLENYFKEQIMPILLSLIHI